MIMQRTIFTIAIIGLILAIYAFYTERKLAKNKNYKAVCDFNEQLSCSKNFKSAEAKTFFIPNSVLGILFFIIIIILAYFNRLDYIFYISLPSTLFTIYLAYVSYIKLKNFCLVCTSTYIVNILIFYISYIGR